MSFCSLACFKTLLSSSAAQLSPLWSYVVVSCCAIYPVDLSSEMASLVIGVEFHWLRPEPTSSDTVV